jgi:non-specific serine/threonine protein kinase
VPLVTATAAPSGGPLTAREQEVAALVARGLTNYEIAERLVITRRTAEAHVTHILSKLGLRSRAQIALWAAQHGLVKQPSA